MTERWIRWEPLPDLAAVYQIEHIHDTVAGLEVLLSDIHNTSNLVRVFFPQTFAYRVQKKIGRHAVCNNWTFFQVEHSSYIQRLIEQSYTILATYNPVHFVFVGTHVTIHVVSHEPDSTALTLDLSTETLLYKNMVLPWIIRNLPTANIILYKEDSESNAKNAQINLALDQGRPIESFMLTKIKKDLDASTVPLTCHIVDIQSLPEKERNRILKKSVIWK